MTFDSKKNNYGESLSSGVAIYPSACKYTVNGALEKRNVTLDTAISDTYLGTVDLTGQDIDFFSTSNPHMKIDDEIVKVSISASFVGLMLNGLDQQVNIPSHTLTSDYEVEIIFAQSVSQSPSGYLLSHATDFNLRVQSVTDRIVIDHPTTTTSQSLGTTLQVSLTQTNTLNVKKTGSIVSVTLNGVTENFDNLNFTAPTIDTVGRWVSGAGFFNGRVLGLKTWVNGSAITGTIARNYPFNDGFSNDPVISDVASSQDGTAINATPSSWGGGVQLTARGQFGTVAVSHGATPALLIHGGEADGSCMGYPKRPDGGGCSTNDSFDRNAVRKFLFINGQSYDGQIYYNGLRSLNHKPCEVKPGVAMAKNASNSIVISDNTDDDTYSVPYPERRTSNSTLFKKLLSRTGGYLQNRTAEVFTGFEANGNFSEKDCVRREYIIDSVSLSDSNFNLKLLDPLMLAEESKTKIPSVSAGKLLNAINDTSTTIELKDFIAGEYGNDTDNITLIIENEMFDCTIVSGASGTLSINSRGVGGSEEKDHDINSSVQLVIVLNNYNPVTEIVNALKTTNIKAVFYGDYSSAEANVTNATGPVYIYKPDSVAKYINAIIRTWAESNITLYFDEREQIIKIKTIGDFEQQPITLDYSEDIKQESLKIQAQYEKQYTRSTIGFAPFNSAKSTNDENSGIVFESINVLTELTGTLEPQIDKTFYTQFLSNSDTDVQIAVSGAARTANLNTKPPEIFTFKIDYSNYGAVEGGVIEEAEIINLTTDETVDDYGNPKANNLQILSLKDNPEEATYTVKAMTYQDIINEDDYDFIIDADKENYDLSTEFAPVTPGEYVVFITSGTTIGATSVNDFAFTTGVQATGVTFKIVFRGSVLGAGGRGADGVSATALNPSEGGSIEITEGLIGFVGGDSLNLTVDCVIDVSQGVVFSGGGGAQSSRSLADSINNELIASNAGSGGQGYVGGLGGDKGDAEIDGGTIAYGLDGQDGTRAAPGTVAGIAGGAFGEYGGQDLSAAPGYAIRANGNNVTIIGDNNLTIKGLRDF